LTKRHQTELSIVAYVETLLWYHALGLTKHDFDNDLAEIGVELTQLTEELAEHIATYALKHRTQFPFKHHARDYAIGATALTNGAKLVTYNLKDFKWVIEEGGKVDTPEGIVEESRI
jgi:predicted nucleic acid-binding protein